MSKYKINYFKPVFLASVSWGTPAGGLLLLSDIIVYAKCHLNKRRRGGGSFHPSKFSLSTTAVCCANVNISLPVNAAVVINEKIYTSSERYRIEQAVHNNPPPRPAARPTNS